MQVSGHGSNQVLLLILSGGYLLEAVEVASSIYVNQLNATKLKSFKPQFQFQFELSLAQLSPSLFSLFLESNLQAGRECHNAAEAKITFERSCS